MKNMFNLLNYFFLIYNNYFDGFYSLFFLNASNNKQNILEIFMNVK